MTLTDAGASRTSDRVAFETKRKARVEERVRRHGRVRAEVQTVRLARRIDRIFAVLLTLEWAAAVGLAYWLSPHTWEGGSAVMHPHIFAAALIGGAVNLVPVGLALRYQGRPITRHSIAVAQIVHSSLLIHLTGGRIETHFHIFCSLAFLASYRDWKVLILPTLLTAGDHYIRGRWWPESMYGIAAAAPWRWLEHAGWVLFEDVILAWGCVRGANELRKMSDLTVRERAALQVAHRHAQAERDAARQADNAKSAFLANMSHEIRTPLNAILGFTDVLRSGNCPPAERNEHLDTIRSSGDHLLALINDILDLSKVESGRMAFERIACNPNKILAGVLSGMRVVAAEKGLSLECRWNGPVPATIVTDSARLRQILLNLVGNAIKFTPGGCVRLAAEVVRRTDGRGYLFAVDVVDTGEGIAPDKLSAIFDPFTQADASVTRRHGGTGLGLSISRQISEALGGTIVAASRRGRGSLFRVTVDAGDLKGVAWVDPSEEGIPAEAFSRDDACSIAPERRVRTDARVLLVDDGEVNRRLIRVVLQRAGLTPVEAVNGHAALEAALAASQADRAFDLILMDMQMPVMDGYTAATEMRSAGITAPIIALTAHAMSGDRAKCVAAGCSDYLSKPVRPADLLAVMGRFVPARDDETAIAPDAVAGAAIEEPSPQSTFVASPIERPTTEDQSERPYGCELSEEDSDLWPIAADFAASLPDRLEACRALLSEGDAAGLSSAAHKLAGTAGTLGYGRFTAPAAALEKAAETDWDEAALTDLLSDLTELTAALHPIESNAPAEPSAT
ncbi:ATP-binding protein [Alienimonas chondri]|uniref:histidine kinase n=1 Tax=Alienimonas chondri TaxID=2681879 RepID=A0ABX1VEZ5_9PLAN|nr:ATP-binding protein [Alienimonas chondri]NNJ26299.1 Sensor histidine kinase RcsC [Alienimonas chondri]